jgi:polyisoprenyl-phosphate glycosyltransferase
VIGAIQLVCLGLLGEYVSRIFTVVQNRPTYTVGYDSLDEWGSGGRREVTPG